MESVENSQSEFPPLSTGLGNPAKGKDAGFPHFHRAGGGIYIYISLSEKEKRKTDAGTEFQLTDPGYFKHHKNVSVASLRS
jgi:hypothetical protein